MPHDSKLHFDCDYLEGAHPRILERLVQTNLEQHQGYGEDEYCDAAKDKIRQAFNASDALIHFTVGGTQTNAIVIKALLKSFEGVISPDSGHICVNEAGIIEAGGHKIIALPNTEGKIFATQVDEYVSEFNNPTHGVTPGMVYISQPTEFGTMYSKDELTELYSVCQKHELPLFIDGARLGYGLVADPELSMEDVAKYSDAFYIGGTKVGALFGEAIVVPDASLIKNLPAQVKQQGALLAKGRLLGVQFDELFTDDLYTKIADHGVKMGQKLKQGFVDAGYELLMDTPTNQVFVVLSNNKKAELEKVATFAEWSKVDDSHTAVRFVTSWATPEEDIDEFLTHL